MLPPKMALPAIVLLMSFAVGFPTLVSAYSIYDQAQGCVREENGGAQTSTLLSAACDTTSILFNILNPEINADVDLLFSRRFMWPPVPPYMDSIFPYMDGDRLNAFLSSLDADLGQNEPQVSWKDFQLGFNYFAAADTAAYYGKFGLSSPNMLFRFSNIDSVREKNHIDIYLNHVHDPWAGVDRYPAHDCNNQPCPDREEDGDPTQCDEYSRNAVQSSAGYLQVRGGPGCSNDYCVSYVQDPNWYLGAHPTNQRMNHEVQHLFYASRTESLWGPTQGSFPDEMLSMANEYLEGATSPDSVRAIWNNVYDWPLLEGPPWPPNYRGIAYSHYYLWMSYLVQQFAGDPSKVEDDLLYKYVHCRDESGHYNNSMYGLARVLDDGVYSSLGGSGSLAGNERLRNLFHDYALAKWINAPPSFYGGRLGFSQGLVPSLTPGFFDNSFNPCVRASAVEVPPRFLVGPERIATDSTYARAGIWSVTDTGWGASCSETHVAVDTIAVWLYGTDYLQFDADPSFANNGKQNTFSFKMNWAPNTYHPGGDSRNSLKLSAVTYSVSGDSLYRKGAFATQVVDACIDTLSGTAEIRVPDFGSATKSVVISIDLGEEYPQAPNGVSLWGRKFYYGYSFGVDTTSVQSRVLGLVAFRPTGSSTDSLSWADPQGYGVTGYYIQRSAGTPDGFITIDSTGCCVYGKSLSPLFGDAVRYYRVVSRGNPLIVSNLATVGGAIDQSQTLSGDLYVSGDLRVAGGKTLDVTPGTRIRIRPNFDSMHTYADASKTELIVDGVLHAIGTSADSIVWESAGNPPIPGDWRGFNIGGASISRMEYNVVRHADHGVITNAAPEIVHSRIQHSQFYGVWSWGAYAGPLISYSVLEQNHGAEVAATSYGDVRVLHCNLRYSSALGQGMVDDGAVFVTNGSGFIRYCSITGVGMGLYCVGLGANPVLVGQMSGSIDSLKYGRNNILDFQSYGVRTYDGALPDLGTPNSQTNWAAGRNNIYTTVAPTALYVSNSGPSTLNAKQNYWGSNPPDLAKFSGPIDGPQIPSRYLNTFETEAGSGFLPAARLPSAEDLYLNALGKELASDLVGAAADYEGIIASYPDDPVAVRSLARLVRIQVRRGKGADEIAYVDRIRTSGVSRDLQNAAKRMMPQLLIHTGNTVADLSAYDELLALPDFDRAGVLLEMALQKGLVLRDSVGARAAVSELRKVCSDKFILKHVRAMLQDVVGPDTWMNAAGSAVPQKTSFAPAFELYQNHPNPSNPITTFSFSVPSTGTVALRIFDVHGRLVRTIVAGTYGAGRHSVQWDGTDDRGRRVASGVYHYQLAAGGKVLSRKLLLLK